MTGILVSAYLCVAGVGFCAGLFIPGAALSLLVWLNILFLMVLVAAWSKPDHGFTPSVIATCVVFWLSALGGRMVAMP